MRFATLTQAMSSTKPTAAKRVSIGRGGDRLIQTRLKAGQYRQRQHPGSDIALRNAGGHGAHLSARLSDGYPGFETSEGEEAVVIAAVICFGVADGHPELARATRRTASQRCGA